MSYASGPALQTAIFAKLSSDAGLNTLVDGAIFDMAPGAAVPARFVAIGPERVTRIGDSGGAGAEHLLEVFVVSESDGFLALKEIAARVSDLLHNADLPLATGTLISLTFQRAEALRRTSDDTRRVRMFFRARIDDDL